MTTCSMQSQDTLSTVNSTEAYTLPDMLSMVPNLLPSFILDLWPSRGAGIKALRLVSKEVGSIALRAVTSCSLTLGEWAYPNPEDVMSLLEDIQLTTLEVKIVTFPRTNYPSPHRQLSFCLPQMVSILARMGITLHTLTHLKLFVSASRAHRLHSTRPPEHGRGSDLYFDPDRQCDVAHIPAKVYAMLAAAVPKLQSLSLGGLCVDVALPVFGSSCPLLKSLTVEAIIVPLHSLEGIDSWFPNLAKFTINRAVPSRDRQRDKAYAQQIQIYISHAVPLLSACSSLKCLQLDLKPSRGVHPNNDVEIRFSHSGYDSLPANLDEFVCDVPVWDMLAAPVFMGMVRSLTLTQLPCNSLPMLLLQAPFLESLALTGEDAMASIWSNKIKTLHLEWECVRARFLSGFQLTYGSMSMDGTSEAGKNLVDWLCPQ